MTDEVTFVGGPWSGMKIHIPERLNQLYGPERFFYRRARLAGDSKVFQVFVPEEWTGDEIIAFLLENMK